MSTAKTPTPSFDPDKLREKYQDERAKRLRDDGNSQWVEVNGQFEHYLDDPYGDSNFTREPLTDEVEVVIVGGGFGGLLAGARLRQAGVENIRLIDAASDFGGTWYWNRYPGISCDIESYTYLPLLEEIGYMPKEKYSHGPEILSHSQAIAKKFDLYRDACFQTRVTELRWDEETDRWIVRTNHGDQMRAHFVCLATGPINRPKLPGIPGLEKFKGHSFHASRWDYDYTGGDSSGNLTGLEDKRVGIIGTGASAVQCVPHVAEWAEQLHVFQRTPSSVDVKHNPPTDPSWAKEQEPGWHRHRMDNFNNLVSGIPQSEDLINDGWTDLIAKLANKAMSDPDMSLAEIMQAVEMVDFEKMEEIRARVDAIVTDKDTAEALKPYYRQFCKRPTFHNEYLESYNRPNVTLVDTKGRGVESITEKGVVVDGKEYDLDCLVYASGFEPPFGTDYSRRAGLEIYGRAGRSLTDAWSEGARTLHGMHVSGFPNCFLMHTIQSGFTANYLHLSSKQAEHIAYIIDESTQRKVRVVEATAEAEQAWVEQSIASARPDQRDFNEKCTPGYYNNEGHIDPLALQNGFYGGGSPAFFKILEAWREAGTFDGLDQL